MTNRPGGRLAALLAVAAVFAVLPASASADLLEAGACDDAPLSRPFAAWGDVAQYKLAPGGDFETGAEGWSLTRGASVVDGSSTHAATGSLGASSLRIPAGGSSTSPATCVNVAYPTLRFFARSTSGLLPILKVDVLYRDGAMRLVAAPAGIVTPSSRWQPTLQMLTYSAVGATLAGGEAPVALRFTAISGTWNVDDVFVDPYRRS